MVDDFDEEAEGEERDGAKSTLSEPLRKALVSGLSAVFMTEQGLRNLVGDMRLPKDAISFLGQQAERSRRELFRVFSEELKGFLKNVDVNGAVRKALTGMKVEVKAELRFIEDDSRPSGVRTELKSVQTNTASTRKRRTKSPAQGEGE